MEVQFGYFRNGVKWKEEFARTMQTTTMASVTQERATDASPEHQSTEKGGPSTEDWAGGVQKHHIPTESEKTKEKGDYGGSTGEE